MALLALGGCVDTRSSTNDAAPEPHAVRVATYNIKHGLGMDGTVDLERTATALEALDADLIALQEVDESARRSGSVNQADWLARRLRMHPAFGAFMDFQDGRYGLAILSRLTVHSTETWRLTDGNEPRVALAVEVALNDGRIVTFICVHFDWVKDDGYRFQQASEVVERMKGIDTPWILLGDFNDTPDSRTLDLIRSIGEDVSKVETASATFPSDQPRREIDYIVAGPPGAWAFQTAQVIEDDLTSDHCAVIANLTLE